MFNQKSKTYSKIEFWLSVTKFKTKTSLTFENKLLQTNFTIQNYLSSI